MAILQRKGFARYVFSAITGTLLLGFIGTSQHLAAADRAEADAARPTVYVPPSSPPAAPRPVDSEPQTLSSTLVFIDTSIADYQRLAEEIGPQARIYLLDGGHDGVRQMAAALARHSAIRTVAILAHGEAGKIRLGSALLDSDGVDISYRSEMDTFRQALAQGADLLLYSCNTGRGAAGQRFVEALAAATGADVAASDDMTGARSLGGNWRLETRLGSIDSDHLLHITGDSYSHLLAITSENFDSAALNIQNNVTTYVVGDWTFTTDQQTDIAVPLYSDFPTFTNSDGGGSDKALAINYNGNITPAVTTIIMKSTDGSDFDLNSFDFGNLINGSQTTLTITAYRDGGVISGSAESVDLTTSDSSGNITYTHLGTDVTQYYGTATFNSVFDNVDEIRFTFGASTAFGVDNISISAAVSNTAPALGGTFTTAGTVNDNATTSPFGGVTVTDADADNVSVSITYTGANGTLSGSGITGSAGSYTVTSAAPATTTGNLQAIVFTPTANQVAPGSTVVTSFTLTPNDGTVNGTADSTTQVTATSINDAPVITSNGGGASASVNINENTTAVTTVASSDADTGETYTYSISGGVDAARFNINSSNGALTFAIAPSYESPTDNGANNVYNVQVTVTDSGAGNLTDVQDLAVGVNNVNENPIITSNGGGSSATVNAAENQTAVTTVTATDQDVGDNLTYSLTGGADQALFTINGGNGVLTFLSAPNYENPVDSGANGVYDVQVTVTDDGAGTLTDVQNIAVTVTNANEAPVITSNGGGSSASVNINENTTAITTVNATDMDAADSLTYSISGGADAARFSINSSNGALTFASAPSYESPTDSGANNVYDVQVTVTDDGTGNLTDSQNIAVTVNNVNENPIIISNGGGSSATVNAAENQTAVTTVTATDQDAADNLTYSLTGGADQALFTINGGNGVLTFLSAPNYENPVDSGTNGVYDVQVTVTDDGAGTLTDVQNIAVTVTNANEAPVITSNGGGASASVNINENTTAVTTVAATDVDTADSLTYAISGGADAARFNINSSNGALTFASAPNYESPTDSGANNVYDVQVTVTDSGTLTDTQTIAVTVIDVNESPLISSTPLTSATDDALYSYTFTVSDEDSGDTLTLSAPTLPAWLSFNAATGVLSGTPTDSEIGAHAVLLRVNDGTVTADQSFSVTVNDINDAPVVSGTPVTRAVVGVAYSFSISATDEDVGDTLSYVMANNPAWLAINATTGVVSGTPGAGDAGASSGILVGANDGTVTTNLAAFTLSVIGDLDSDGQGDDVDTDIDGDGMSNAYEDANGLDKWDAGDRDGDLDGDGVSNYDESVANSDANADDYPPVITPPADVTVDATGLFTQVATGTATASDGLDGAVSVSSDASGFFTPGIHAVTWSASDATGNSATEVQLVNVIPLVELSKDQNTTEGASASFKVMLNGPAVNYPVVVPYTLSGSADAADHNLLAGNATINSSELQTTVSLDLVDDGAGEGTETLVVTLGTPTNAVLGPKSTHTLSIHESNVAPTVGLSATQGAVATRLLQQAGVKVVVTATVSDPNPGDSHSYDWSGTDNALVDLDSAADTFTFAPGTAGTFSLQVRVTDSGSLSNTSALTLNVLAALPTLSASDTDEDGVDDDVEGSGDSDNDGVPDYLDHADLQRNVIQEQSATADQFLIETEPGLSLQLGEVAFRANNGGSGVSANDVATHGNSGTGALADDAYINAGGLFDFTVKELPAAGQSVNIVIPQQAAIPANAVYRKLMPFGWTDFVEDGNNLLMSASGAQGYCPPPGDSAYSAGLTAGHWCVQLTIKDGGANDADGEVNQSILDPGGVATARPVTNNNSGGGGGGGAMDPWYLLLVVLLILAQRYPRTRARALCRARTRRDQARWGVSR